MSAIRCIGTWLAFLKLDEVRDVARESGLERRTPRKLTARTIFVSLVLSVGGEAQRSLAGLARFVHVLRGIVVSRQAIHKRLSSHAADFMRRLYERMQKRLLDLAPAGLPGKLRRFADVNIIDSTTIGLARKLADLFPACRSNVRDAAMKIHACMSLGTRQIRRIRTSGERVHDSKGGLFGSWVRRRLLLFDLGYFDYGLFSRIVAWGGAFLTRLKDRANGTIVAVRRGCKKRHIGTKLNRRIYFGPFVDLDVRLGSDANGPVFRVVGVRDDLGCYHWYVTSLAPEPFPPESLTSIYALRWQIELLFKEWKSLCRITETASGNDQIALALVYASLCAALMATLAMHLAIGHYRLDPHQVCPSSAPKILALYLEELGLALLSRRKRNIRDVLPRLLETLAAHGLRRDHRHALAALTSGSR